MSDHYHGKDALSHVAEKQAQGILSSHEIHGLELSGSEHAFYDSARNMLVLLGLLYAILINLDLDSDTIFKIFALFGLGAIIWFTGRSAWLAWVRLERLHRILAQEKWEIEHNRPQEREELRVLYGSKGFEGPLLEQVVDVLMADESRLLKVMVEEEMGITLQNVEHPLKQGFFSFLGAIASLLAVILTLNVSYLSLAIIFIGVAVFSGIAALKAKNSPIDSAVWSIGIAVLSIGLTYFLTRFIFA